MTKITNFASALEWDIKYQLNTALYKYYPLTQFSLEQKHAVEPVYTIAVDILTSGIHDHTTVLQKTIALKQEEYYLQLISVLITAFFEVFSPDYRSGFVDTIFAKQLVFPTTQTPTIPQSDTDDTPINLKQWFKEAKKDMFEALSWFAEGTTMKVRVYYLWKKKMQADSTQESKYNLFQKVCLDNMAGVERCVRAYFGHTQMETKTLRNTILSLLGCFACDATKAKNFQKTYGDDYFLPIFIGLFVDIHLSSTDTKYLDRRITYFTQQLEGGTEVAKIYQREVANCQALIGERASFCPLNGYTYVPFGSKDIAEGGTKIAKIHQKEVANCQALIGKRASFRPFNGYNYVPFGSKDIAEDLLKNLPQLYPKRREVCSVTDNCGDSTAIPTLQKTKQLFENKKKQLKFEPICTHFYCDKPTPQQLRSSPHNSYS